MNGKLWSKKRDAKLRKLREQGFSAAQIAVQLGGVTRNAVIGRADRMRNDRMRNERSTKPVCSKAAKKQKLLTQVKPVTWGSVLINLTARAKAMFDLEPHHCRWPVSDTPFTFCGDTKQDGSSYCRHHFDISRRGAAAGS